MGKIYFSKNKSKSVMTYDKSEQPQKFAAVKQLLMVKLATRRKARWSSHSNLDAVQVHIVDSWDDFKDALEALSEEESQQLKDHFNNLIEGEENDELGEVLFGDLSDFEQKLCTVSDQDKQTFFDELFEVGVFDLE